MKVNMKPAKGLLAMAVAIVLAGTIGCTRPGDSNNELDVCKQATPAPYASKLHFRLINQETGSDLFAASTPNRYTFDDLTSLQYCNDSHPLEEAADFYKDAQGKDCVTFWFANLRAPDAYSPQECRRVLMRWSDSDIDTLEWTTHVEDAGVPNCDSFEVLDKVFYNSEVIHQVTLDGQTYYPLYKTN